MLRYHIESVQHCRHNVSGSRDKKVYELWSGSIVNDVYNVVISYASNKAVSTL